MNAAVAGGLDDAVAEQLLGYDLGVAITGTERLGLTDVVTEGFGRMTVGNPLCVIRMPHLGSLGEGSRDPPEIH